jgi:hypothetical protein
MLGLVALMLKGFHIDAFLTAIAGSLIVSRELGRFWFIGPRGKVEVIRIKRALCASARARPAHHLHARTHCTDGPATPAVPPSRRRYVRGFRACA